MWLLSKNEVGIVWMITKHYSTVAHHSHTNSRCVWTQVATVFFLVCRVVRSRTVDIYVYSQQIALRNSSTSTTLAPRVCSVIAVKSYAPVIQYYYIHILLTLNAARVANIGVLREKSSDYLPHIHTYVYMRNNINLLHFTLRVENRIAFSFFMVFQKWLNMDWKIPSSATRDIR